MGFSDIARWTHPRRSALWTQVAVLLIAALLGLGVGGILLYADQRSWEGSTRAVATITGLTKDKTGIAAIADGKSISLHIIPIPPTGSHVQVELSPRGKARPTSYRQTWHHAAFQGVSLLVGLTIVVQLYRFFVTRKAVPVD